MIPIITVEEMRVWENASWEAGISERKVIGNVGEIIAAHLLKNTKKGDLIVFLAGKGNNGADARAAAEHLNDRRTVFIDTLAPKTQLQSVIDALAKRPKVVVDALFGTGLNRELNKDWINLINTVNESHLQILSIDIPSGLSGTDGTIRGAAIRADVTLSLGGIKTGLVKGGPNTALVGHLICEPHIGLYQQPAQETQRFWIDKHEFLNFPPRRSCDSHKGTHGHLCILAGSLGYHGAAVLCAKAAAKSRPGLTTVLTSRDALTPIASQLATQMVNIWQGDLPERITCLVIGPGLAGHDLDANLKTEFQKLWENFPHPIIVDATALDWIPKNSTETKGLRVLTPHPGEAARMLNVTTEEIQKDRESSVRKLSQKYANAIVVLKGQHTLVATTDSEITYNGSGNPALAQGGEWRHTNRLPRWPSCPSIPQAKPTKYSPIWSVETWRCSRPVGVKRLTLDFGQ
ncbi:NAD(P)H-hydrate dehydratase [Verrucomicrobia bacterium]|nr:NAD(P)H-hydrate dehydratase [Verrucomicrobiota bacterium]